jgi:hypothetical protein
MCCAMALRVQRLPRAFSNAGPPSASAAACRRLIGALHELMQLPQQRKWCKRRALTEASRPIATAHPAGSACGNCFPPRARAAGSRPHFVHLLACGAGVPNRLEALQNTYKHARTATAARVRIATRGRELTFEVTDNGLGFDPAMVAPGAGLHNMHDRVASLGGSLTIDARPGTRITGVIPLVGSSAGTGRGDASGWTRVWQTGD